MNDNRPYVKLQLLLGLYKLMSVIDTTIQDVHRNDNGTTLTPQTKVRCRFVSFNYQTDSGLVKPR